MASQIEQSTDAHGELQQAAAASEAALTPYAVLNTPPEAAFDDLAQLAADLCGVPVALVTLFESRRQWFKARIGVDLEETLLGDALCAHALTVAELLVIPDLSIDPRTRDNNLVAGEPGLRFYAGAPLRTPGGTFLGTLCVIDFAARPDGLTEAQANGLKALARQVMATLELRRLLAERDTALDVGAVERQRLASTAALWHGLFQGLREGFMIGAVIRDDAGKIVDWDHLEVNEAFLNVTGFAADQVIGRTALELAPDLPRRWIDFTAAVVNSGTPATFEQIGAANRRRYDGRTFPIGNDQFATIFVDVTDRIAAERRQAALIAISDLIRDLDRLEDMTHAAAGIVGELMGAIRAGFGRLDHRREMVTVEPDWTAPGITSVVGTHRMADYGNLLGELLAGEPLVLNDVTTDPRTAGEASDRLLELQVAAQVHMPMRERGRTVGIFFVQSDHPRDWSEPDLAFLRDVADRMEVAVNRLEQETRRVLQTQELSHRVKNTLAMVQAIASQTLKPVTERAAVDNFERRLTTLATAHDVLLGTKWEAAPLNVVIRAALDSAGQDGRVHLNGPPVDLSPRAVLSTSLLIHELATNAVKYGALSAQAGEVAVDWIVRNRDGRPILFLNWVERGGPPVVAPTRRGFGSRLINMGLVGTGGVDLDYSQTGFTARMSAPVDDLTKT